MVANPKNEQLQASVLHHFFSADGRLKHMPSQHKKKVIVLEHLADQLEPGKKYTEKEMNEFIKLVHEDFATIRREFIVHRFMSRENEIYELNPQDEWTQWRSL